MDLNQLGWNSLLAKHFTEIGGQDRVPARVVREHRQLYSVVWERGELVARVSGRMMHAACSRADFPAVGDWVSVKPQPDEDRATIHAILPRKSKFCRKVASVKTEEQVIAANVDTVFLVSALDGNFNLRRLERYLTLAWESGARPVIVLNKADLCADVESYVAQAGAVALGVPVHAISALEGRGLDDIRTYLERGQTGALLGSSGVGKSTIINSLLGCGLLEVREVRRSDGKGRHVTSTRHLVILPSGGMIIDTPGMRELQLWGDEGSLSSSFDDIESLARACRFKDCGHNSEPGCAVREAIAGGRLSEDRLRNYFKLQRELAYLSIRKEQRARLREKRWKEIAKWQKQRQKQDPKARG